MLSGVTLSAVTLRAATGQKAHHKATRSIAFRSIACLCSSVASSPVFAFVLGFFLGVCLVIYFDLPQPGPVRHRRKGSPTGCPLASGPRAPPVNHRSTGPLGDGDPARDRPLPRVTCRPSGVSWPRAVILSLGCPGCGLAGDRIMTGPWVMAAPCGRPLPGVCLGPFGDGGPARSTQSLGCSRRPLWCKMASCSHPLPGGALGLGSGAHRHPTPTDRIGLDRFLGDVGPVRPSSPRGLPRALR